MTNGSTHGAGSLAVAMRGLDALGDVRAALEWISQCGARGVQLNAAASGLRPRELDRSARRDLAALLRRCELRMSGVDLLIPPLHFTDPAHEDRAWSALAQAVELAAELAALGEGAPVVTTLLPDEPRDSLLEELGARIERVGARVALINDPSERDGNGPVGCAVDPALLRERGDIAPDQFVLERGARVLSARLSDTAQARRVAAGDGALDVRAYAVALTTAAPSAPVVVDLWGVEAPEHALARTLERWRDALAV